MFHLSSHPTPRSFRSLQERYNLAGRFHEDNECGLHVTSRGEPRCSGPSEDSWCVSITGVWERLDRERERLSEWKRGRCCVLKRLRAPADNKQPTAGSCGSKESDTTLETFHEEPEGRTLQINWKLILNSLSTMHFFFVKIFFRLSYTVQKLCS